MRVKRFEHRDHSRFLRCTYRTKRNRKPFIEIVEFSQPRFFTLPKSTHVGFVISSYFVPHDDNTQHQRTYRCDMNLDRRRAFIDGKNEISNGWLRMRYDE